MKAVEMGTLERFTALAILQRAWRESATELIVIPTQFGTFYFGRDSMTPERALDRICRFTCASPMSVARWLKDWNRQPLDSYVES